MNIKLIFLTILNINAIKSWSYHFYGDNTTIKCVSETEYDPKNACGSIGYMNYYKYCNEKDYCFNSLIKCKGDNNYRPVCCKNGTIQNPGACNNSNKIAYSFIFFIFFILFLIII